MSNKKIFDMGKNKPKNPEKTWINPNQLGGGPPKGGVPLSPDKTNACDEEDIETLRENMSDIAKKMGLSTAKEERFRQEYQMDPNIMHEMGDYPRDNVGSRKPQRAEELLTMVDSGVISKKDLADRLGVDWKMEMHRRHKASVRMAAKAVRDKERQKLAQEALMPFFKNLAAKDNNGWFKRGDVSRVLKITPKEAGKLLRSAAYKGGLLQNTRDGWWYCTMRRQKEASFGSISVPSMSQPLPPMPPPQNIFGGQAAAVMDKAIANPKFVPNRLSGGK